MPEVYKKMKILHRFQWTFPFVAHTVKVDARITLFRADIENCRMEQAGHHELHGDRSIEIEPHIVLL